MVTDTAGIYRKSFPLHLWEKPLFLANSLETKVMIPILFFCLLISASFHPMLSILSIEISLSPCFPRSPFHLCTESESSNFKHIPRSSQRPLCSASCQSLTCADQGFPSPLQADHGFVRSVCTRGYNVGKWADGLGRILKTILLISRGVE